MPGLRQDYILRQIELLRQFVARLCSDRDERSLDEALNLSLHLQARLFPLPVADFLQLDADAQHAALVANESPGTAREKCLAYAALLRETATLYDLRGRDDLARGARQLALHVALLTALAPPSGANDGELHRLTQDLTGELDPEDLPPPLGDLVAEFKKRIA